MVQLRGPFEGGKEVMPAGDKAKHLGIQVELFDPVFVYINNIKIEIGQTGMYEIEDVEVTSIKFEKDMNEKTFVEYILA